MTVDGPEPIGPIARRVLRELLRRGKAGVTRGGNMFTFKGVFRRFEIRKAGLVRLTWLTSALPGDAPPLAEGDVVTRTPPGGLAVHAICPGIAGNCRIIRERFERKGGVCLYTVTLEFTDLDGDEDSTRELLTLALRLDLSGNVSLRPAQGALDLGETANGVH